MHGHQQNTSRPARVAAAAVAAAFLTGCSTAYYSAWEMLGREKRDLLRSNVESVKKEHQAAADEFEDAEGRAEDIRDRIDTIESIAEDLFKEWDQEIGEISNANYRNKSRAKLNETRAKYGDLAASLEKSEASMEPVLTHLNDSVLFLKHNLNAAAIGGLAADMEGIESDIEQLIADMRASINEADNFLKTLPE